MWKSSSVCSYRLSGVQNNEDSTLTVMNSTIVGNASALGAGGVDNGLNSTATFTNEGCDVCHGDSATPDTTQIELAGLGMRYTVEELAEYLGTPQAPMPPYEADANARRALAIYLVETY